MQFQTIIIMLQATRQAPRMCSAVQRSLATKIGPWGGNGGSHVDAAVVALPHRLETVTVRSDVVVDSLAYSYLDQAGQKHIAGPWGSGNAGKTTTVS